MKIIYKIFPKDLKITLFGIGWWFYTILTALTLFIVSYIGNRFLNYDQRLRMILIISIIEFIIMRIYKYSLKYIRSDYNYYNELPCYLCNQSTILCIIASMFNNTHIMAFCIIIGTLGAVLAFVLPDSYNKDQPFYSAQAVGFYGYHGLLIVTCLSFYTLNVYTPDLKDALWNMFMIFFLACLTHVINVFLIKTGLNPKANYVYTVYPDNGFLKMLYKLNPHQLIYMLPIMFIFGVFSIVLLLIM